MRSRRPSLLAASLRAAALIPLAVLALALAGCGSARSRTSATSATGTATNAGAFAGAPLPGRVVAPGFTLTDRSGRRVSLSSYRGRVVVLSFLYSTCGAPCDLIAQQIRGALDELGDDGGNGGQAPAVLIVSSDPAADTPASVHGFLARASLGGRVFYVLGPRTRLSAAWRAYPALAHGAGERGAGRFAGVMLIDRRGLERVLFGVEQLTPESLAHDIRALASS